MKVSLQYSGDMYEDRETLDAITHALDMHSAIWEAKELIRTRLKHGEGVSDAEELTLEAIRDALYVGGVS